MGDLSNKTILVTGLRALGRTCALAAARQGANIILAGMPMDGIESFVEEAQSGKSRIVYMPCDLSEPGEVEHMLRCATRLFPRIDVALNSEVIDGSTPHDLCMEYELRQMREQGEGVIVNISAFIGQVGQVCASHYVTARHGIHGFRSSTLLEYAGEGIRINAITPGVMAGFPIATIAAKNIEPGNGLSPLPKSSQEALANLFLFLVSMENAFVFGTTLEVNNVPDDTKRSELKDHGKEFFFPDAP